MSTLSGVMPILPTIFDGAGRVDRAGTRRVLEYVIDSGAAAVVFPGLASEYDTLSVDERLEMTEALGGWMEGRVPLIVGASAADEADVVRYAQAGAQAGAVAAMVLTPKALAGDVQAMTCFYRTVHAASGIAVMVQNAPAPMGIGMPLAQIAAMAHAVDGIRYVKEEAPPSGQRITELRHLAGDAIDAVFGGAGGRYVIDEFVRGATGVMPACEITELHVRMHAHFVQGELQQARDLFERTLPLLNMQANFRWRLTKAVLQRRGLIEHTFTRAAGPALDAFDEAELEALLARLCDARLLALPDRV